MGRNIALLWILMYLLPNKLVVLERYFN